MKMKLISTKDYLLWVDEEAEIVEGNIIAHLLPNNKWYTATVTKKGAKDLNKNSKAHKVISYRKLNEEAKELDLPELPNPFETIDCKFDRELFNPLIAPIVEKIRKVDYSLFLSIGGQLYDVFLKQYEAAQSKQGLYSLDDMKEAIRVGVNIGMQNVDKPRLENDFNFNNDKAIKECEEFIQSLSTQQLPKEFYPYLVFNEKGITQPQIIMNPKGKRELVGKYIY